MSITIENQEHQCLIQNSLKMTTLHKQGLQGLQGQQGLQKAQNERWPPLRGLGLGCFVDDVTLAPDDGTNGGTCCGPDHCDGILNRELGIRGFASSVSNPISGPEA